MSYLRRNFLLFLKVLCMITLRYGECNSGLLTSTLRAFEHTACDGEEMTLKCPETTMINVQFSQYGRQLPSYQVCPSKTQYFLDEDTNCLATSSLRVLFDQCQNRRKCQVIASTDTFRQDPCPKTSKYLKVSYRCNPSAYSNVTVCDGDQLLLNCSKGTRIAVYSAMWGRTSSDTSQCKDRPQAQSYADCRSSSALEEVMTRCHGLKRCAIEVQEYVFGNPCPQGIQKYLKVVYTCVPKKILKHTRKIRHKNKKGGRRKGKKSTTVSVVSSESIPKMSTSSVLNMSTRSTPNMYPAVNLIVEYQNMESSTCSSDDSKQRNLDKKGDLSINTDVKGENTDSRSNIDSTLSSVICPNNSLATPAPSSIGRGASGAVVDWFNAFNFLKDNEEKAVLYMMLGVFGGLIALLIVVIVKLIIRNKHQRRTKLDVTDPVHAHSTAPENHIEAPTLSRHDSIDRIEVVRFEPRSTLMRASLLDSNGDRSLNHYYS